MAKFINVADMIQAEVIKALIEKGYVQVVRCKNCKWSNDDCSECLNPDLALGGDYTSCLYIEPDWYCADGKRKEKTDE